jgi:hypothetical protein
MAASGDEGRRVQRPTHSQALKETAARHRHGIPPSAGDYQRERLVEKPVWEGKCYSGQVNRANFTS